MTSESFLSSAVEVAIGMAGFAGIIAAVRNRNLDTWPQGQRIVLSMLLMASAMATAFALLPAILFEAGATEAVGWRIGSAALLLWMAGITVYRVRQFRSSDAGRPLSSLLSIWMVLIAGLQGLNLSLAEAWPYLVGVFGLLVNGFSFFWALLLGRSRNDRTAP